MCLVFFIYVYNKRILQQCVDPVSCMMSRCLCNAVSPPVKQLEVIQPADQHTVVVFRMYQYLPYNKSKVVETN